MLHSLNLQCPVCGSDSWDRILKAPDFELNRCAGGCVIRTVPPPEFSSGLPEGARPENLTKRKGSGHFALAEQVLNLATRHRNSGSLLDVGCGWGQLLKLAGDHGYDAMGLEASAGVAEIARRAFDVKVTVGSFPLTELNGRSFDVVVLSHILEHLPNPVEALKEAARILRPGGIVAIAVPNFDSLMSRIKRDKWQGIKADQHVWQLTPASVRLLVEAAGLKLWEMKFSNLHYERGAGSLLKWLALRAVLLTAGVFHMGDHLIVIAGKDYGF